VWVVTDRVDSLHCCAVYFVFTLSRCGMSHRQTALVHFGPATVFVLHQNCCTKTAATEPAATHLSPLSHTRRTQVE
jgi:hypothetical protein